MRGRVNISVINFLRLEKFTTSTRSSSRPYAVRTSITFYLLIHGGRGKGYLPWKCYHVLLLCPVFARVGVLLFIFFIQTID